MTCIIGIAQGGRVWMGADTYMGSMDLVYRAESKLFRAGNFLIGGAGGWRYCQLLAYALKLSPPKKGRDIRHYMATDFARAIRAAVSEYGCMEKDEDGSDSVGSRALIGAGGCLFNFDGVLSHIPIEDGFAAIGSGAHVAMGSLYETQNSDLKPGERLSRALEAAEALTDGVRRPFTYEHLEPYAKVQAKAAKRTLRR